MLDDFPLATVQTLAGIVIAVAAYINHDISVAMALLAVGGNTAGAGLVGHARNGAGRGVRR
jgi:hypothetical protein